MADGKERNVAMNCKRLLAVLVTTATAATISSATLAQPKGSAEEGELVFRKCRSCHQVGPEARNMVGPVLNGVIGRQAGTIAGFSYSELNKAAGVNGLVWTDELIFNYLADPAVFLKQFLTDKGKSELATGTTRMVFKLPDETERWDVIAYLRRFSPPAASKN